MRDENSIDDDVPLIFREPERIVVKPSKKRKKKNSKNKGDLGCALQKTIAKELKALKKADSKKTKSVQKKQPKTQDDKPNGAYQMTPPECSDAAYNYHSIKVPDPYRPLENVEDEKVKGWINYQIFRTKKYLADAKLSLKIVDTLTKYERYLDHNKTYNECSYEGYVFGSALYEGLEKKIGNTVFSLRFHDDRTEIYSKTPHKAERLIICDRDIKFKGRTIRLNRLKINPRATYALCEIQDAFEEKKYDCVPLCLKTGNIYDIHHQNALHSFLCWDSKNNGYYYEKDGGLYYCALRRGSYKVSDVAKPRDPKGGWRTGCYDFLKGNGMVFLYEESPLYSSKFTKYDAHTEHFYIDFSNPLTLHPMGHVDVSHIDHPHRFLGRGIVGVHDGYAYATAKDNLGKTFLLRLPIGEDDWSQSKTILNAKEIASHVQNNIMFINGKIITIENEDLQTVLNIYTMTGKKLFSYKHETPSSFLFEGSHQTGHKVKFYASCYDRYRDLYEIDTRTFKVKLITPAPCIKDFNLGMKRVFAKSKDGTKVPMTILYNKNLGFKKNARTILYMYGGFGTCQKPAFQPEILTWIENGGVWAISHPRGDGGWKKDWAAAGARRNMQNTLDDIAACAQYLIDHKITAHNKLIGLGASNGGRTVASVMLQNPALFSGIICQIPVLDMLNAMMTNYDDQKDAFLNNFGDYFDYYDFQKIRAASPLHSIQDNAKYPPTLIMAQGKDDRAHPGHALKFLATMLDRAKGDDCYLMYKEDGNHDSLYQTKPWGGDTDYDVFVSMFAFIETACGRKN